MDEVVKKTPEFDGGNLIIGEEAIVATSNPRDNVGKSLEVSGSIFDFFSDDDYVYARIYQDFEDYKNDVSLRIKKSEASDIKEDIYVIAQGVILGDLESRSIRGGNISTSVIGVENIKVGKFEDTVAKAIKTFDINQTQTQHNISVTLQKIEVSQYDIRAYVEIKNNSYARVKIYSYQSYLIIDGRNYTEEYPLYTTYPEVDLTLNPFTYSEGIMALKALESDLLDDIDSLKDIKFTLPAPFSSNWELEFEDFTFDVLSN